ncbi:MAG: SGNH/GDSL hydrolase family protein [Chitinophagaceae bacterium]
MKVFFKKVFSVFIGIAIALIICEIFLHFYNPFPFAITKGKLVLPSNQKTVFTNSWIKKLDSKIFYSRNSLGFRGPEPTDSISKIFSIICVGGSTTECRFISDSLTWTSKLYKNLHDSIPAVWLNNAGVEGHSSFGHLLLMQEYITKIKPRYVTFLVGINDVETDKPVQFDLMNEKKINFLSPKSFVKSLLNKTALGFTLFQLYAIRGAYKKGLIHKEIDYLSLRDTLLTSQATQELLNKQKPYLSQYAKRIENMILLCKQNNIIPILFTQPSMYGDFTDSYTQINMADKYLPQSNPAVTGKIMGEILEMYNDVIRSFGNRAKVVDLAALMPKNSMYYYDFIHYTNSGCQKVADVLSQELIPYLKLNH